jgi:hypothetical protein
VTQPARLFVALLAALGATSACVEPLEPELATSADELASANGLPALNGLGTNNGLGTQNGLNLNSGLSTQSGLASGTGLMATASGRVIVAYLVRCALPAGRSVSKTDASGTSYTFQGSLGVAPKWETGKCDGTCQAWVSACMIAHINTAGVSVPLWLVADSKEQPQIGWGLDAEYPHQEGAYFGNIFESPARLYYCNGRDWTIAPPPGRLGDPDMTEPPYVNPYGADAPCSAHCATPPSPYQTSGYGACTGGNSKVITVWRQ